MSGPRVRRALSLWLAASLCLLSACASMQPRATLTLWHTLDGARERALLQLVDRWNQGNPDGIVVVPERRAPKAQHRALLEGDSTGRLPSLALVMPAQAAVYAQRNALSQLDEYANSSDPALGWDAASRADLYPFVLQAGRTPQGQLMGVPMGGDARMLLGDRDWAATLGNAALPATWGAFNKHCNAATDRLAGTLCFGVNPNDVLFEEWVLAHGAPVYDAANNVVLVNTPATVGAVDVLVNYIQTGVAYRTASSSRSIEDFASGRVMFALDWTNALPDYVNTIRGGANFSLDVGTLPSDVGSPVAVFRSPLWVLPRGAPEDERRAWQFVRWLLEGEQTAAWAAATGELPARASAINRLNVDAASALGAAQGAILQRVAQSAQPSPLLSGWPCVQDEMAAGLRQIFEGQLVTDTLNATQARAQAVLNEDCSAP